MRILIRETVTVAHAHGPSLLCQATDSIGAVGMATQCVQPIVSTVFVVSSPPGLTFTLDGAPNKTPFVWRGVFGASRIVSAPDVQSLPTAADIAYTFVAWSDGGARTHAYSPAAPGTNNTLRLLVQRLPASSLMP